MSTNTEQTENNVKSSESRNRSSGALLFLRVMICVLLVAVIALGALLYLAKTGRIFQSEGSGLSGMVPDIPEMPGITEEPVVYTASCVTPLDEVLQVSAAAGETVRLPDGPAIEGYTFVGWADSQGNRLENGEVKLDADASFSAVYAIAFRQAKDETSHAAYLPLSGDGYFRPRDLLKRAEAAQLLYSMLDTDYVGDGSFADVPEGTDCHRAVATLKDLGVISGNRFHPDEPICFGDLFDMLASFFPKSSSAYSFDLVPQTDPRYSAFCLAMDQGWITDGSVSPDQDVTRADAARIFNRLCGRAPIAENDYSKVGTILDVSFDDPSFWDIAEAAIPHESENSENGELWTSSSSLPLYTEGLFFIGTELHCVDERGSAVINASYGNFDFGADGVITTGMPELDELVQEKVSELVDPNKLEDESDREQMLRVLFNYVTYHNSYLRLHYYEVGDTSWVNDEAYHMLTEKKGNCYDYAAEFYVLARAIGYDAVIYSGKVDPTQRPHAWVEIEFDGVPYIFDTEIEFTQVTIAHKGSTYFKCTYEKLKTWYYFRG